MGGMHSISATMRHGQREIVTYGVRAAVTYAPLNEKSSSRAFHATRRMKDRASPILVSRSAVRVLHPRIIDTHANLGIKRELTIRT